MYIQYIQSIFEKYVYKWLEIALDYGIDETNYWNMTLAEVIRAIESKKRQQKLQAQERASYDYILASLITKGVSIVLGSKESFPQIQEAYPKLFDDLQEIREEEIQKKKIDLSVIRLKQFTQSWNNRFHKEVSKQINE